MITNKLWLAIACGMAVAIPVLTATSAEPVEIVPLMRAINGVAPKGVGHREAIAAWKQLAQAKASQIPEILAQMDPSGTLSANWVRSAVETVVQRELAAGGHLPQAALEQFLADASHAPRARRLAYELILQVDPGAKPRLVPMLLVDPSLELRRDGVAHALTEAKRLLDAQNRSDAIAAFRRGLVAARDLDQVNEAAARLRDLGETVDLPRHFGFITQWKLIGPFENANMSGFDVAYGPEQNLDLAAEYDGKSGRIKWLDHTTADPYGTVDLNSALGKHKGAITYAFAEFVADQDRDAEFRLGCITGSKLWVNGELLMVYRVFHTATYMDQYVARGRLKPGRNVILLKIAQNEQTESWAQRWQFQFRVCDQYGTAILSSE